MKYGPDDIDEDFREKNSKILNVKRGNGLWIWKPYIINKTLERVNYGDFVFYCDSGAFFFRSVEPVIKNMGNNNIWISNTGCIEKQWNKPKVFEILNIHDENIKNSFQVQASFVLVRKSEEACRFIRKWLELVQNPELIMPLEPGEFKGDCIEHREDQSCLSLLCKLEGIKGHKTPALTPPVIFRKKEKFSDDEMYSNDKYKKFILHHRIRTAHNMAEFVIKLILVLTLPSGLKRNLVKLKHAIKGVPQ